MFPLCLRKVRIFFSSTNCPVLRTLFLSGNIFSVGFCTPTCLKISRQLLRLRNVASKSWWIILERVQFREKMIFRKHAEDFGVNSRGIFRGEVWRTFSRLFWFSFVYLVTSLSSALANWSANREKVEKRGRWWGQKQRLIKDSTLFSFLPVYFVNLPAPPRKDTDFPWEFSRMFNLICRH